MCKRNFLLLLIVAFHVLFLSAQNETVVTGNRTYTGRQYIDNNILIIGDDQNQPDSSKLIFSYYRDHDKDEEKHGFITYPKQLWIHSSSIKNVEGVHFNKYGEVGIGTWAHSGIKLSVNGVIKAKEVRIELISQWPDFVFNKDYSLPSLEEVKTYIDEHKHLPDMPSESKVKANGVELAEMSAKLLQKVEELTLYVIQQNEKLNEQNKKLNEQVDEISDLKKELGDLKNEHYGKK